MSERTDRQTAKLFLDTLPVLFPYPIGKEAQYHEYLSLLRQAESLYIRRRNSAAKKLLVEASNLHDLLKLD